MPLAQTWLLAWLKVHDLVRDPATEARRMAAEWDALPDENKQAHIAGCSGPAGTL